MDYTIETSHNAITIVMDSCYRSLSIGITNLLYELGATDNRELWKSKYNIYIVYDYEPFCSEGFNCVLEYLFDDFNKLKFAQYQLNKFLEKYNQLEKIYKLNIDLRSKDGIKIKELMEV